jgi:FkbM family methyltransferase
MSHYWTQNTAVVSAYRMWRDKYTPATIVDVGLGAGWPELYIWLWLYPDAKIVGADPRGRRHRGLKNVQYFRGLIVGDETVKESSFCWKCRSAKCYLQEEHKPHAIIENHVMTLDQLVADSPPPYFLWVDVEGSELEVLRGGEKMLSQTRWINIEVRDWGPTANATDIPRWMAEHGYDLALQHQNTVDCLYRKRGG